MKPLKQRYSLSLDENIMDELKQLAEADDRSLSQYVNMVLKEYLLKRSNTVTDN